MTTLRLVTTLLITTAVGLWLGACGPREPSVRVSTEELDSRTTCSTDADCVISCYTEDDCCGDGCQCTHAYSKAYDQLLAQAREKSCKGDWSADGCPVYDCPMPTHDYVAVCERGSCRSKRVPLETLEKAK